MHDKLEILDLRRCDFDGLFYPRCEMILTSFGLIAKQHAVKLFEPDECGNEYGLKSHEVTLWKNKTRTRDTSTHYSQNI